MAQRLETALAHPGRLVAGVSVLTLVIGLAFSLPGDAVLLPIVFIVVFVYGPIFGRWWLRQLFPELAAQESSLRLSDAIWRSIAVLIVLGRAFVLLFAPSR